MSRVDPDFIDGDHKIMLEETPLFIPKAKRYDEAERSRLHSPVTVNNSDAHSNFEMK